LSAKIGIGNSVDKTAGMEKPKDFTNRPPLLYHSVKWSFDGMIYMEVAQDRLIAYYRVSTARQGASQLGLDAQRAAVTRFLKGTALMGEFTEVESGKRNDRPELAKALAACKLYRAKLIIAKLDRLARNVAFISNLMDSDVEFIAADFPEANRLTIHILAAVAEHEREMISQRTRAALTVAKARGVKLGNPRLKPGTNTKPATEAKIVKARVFSEHMLPVILGLDGTLKEKAEALNNRGITTSRGGRWNAASVMRVLRQQAPPRA